MSERKSSKIYKSPIGIAFIILCTFIIGGTFFGAIESIVKSYSCEHRGMLWISSPPYKRVGDTISREMTIGKYSGWYQEKYTFGYCISPEQK